ncbi:MAG: EAL domain-containing protein [Alphaproteobacteria bacterium]|nr:EAL domain-containing protein [Alphaproteobacteria bacterium]
MMRRLARPGLAGAIALLHAVIAGSYILLSDAALSWFVADPGQRQALELAKGLAFVAVTSLLLFLGLRAGWRQLARARSRLQLALEGHGILWEVDFASGRIWLSPEATGLLGLDAAAYEALLASGRWSDLVHADDLAGLELALDRTRILDEPFHQLFRMRHRDGHYLWLKSEGRVRRDRKGVARAMTGMALDVTRLIETQARLRRVSRFDLLTGLPNRDEFLRLLAARLAPDGERGGWLLRLDVIRFREINSELGFAAGDEVLRQLARRLLDAAGPQALVSRLPADEFAIYTSDPPDELAASDFAARLAKKLRAPLDLSGRVLQVECRIGLCVFPRDARSPQELLAAAGLALSEMPRGSAGIRYYDSGMDMRFRARIERLDALRHALERRQILLHFQPVISLVDGAVLGFEALVRWQIDDDTLLPPGEFLPLAEERGLLEEITAFVLSDACREAAAWPDGIFVAVNVSPSLLGGSWLIQAVDAALSGSGLAPGRLTLEVTETALPDDIAAAASCLGKMRARGIGVAIDDFGTGYSSFLTLQSLPASRLKIDRQFIAGLGENATARAIVGAIIDLSRALALEVTGEGVETAAQETALREAGCASAQGYRFARPLAAVDTKAFIYNHQRKP